MIQDDIAESLQNLRDYCRNLNVEIEASSKRCMEVSLIFFESEIKFCAGTN